MRADTQAEEAFQIIGEGLDIAGFIAEVVAGGSASSR